MLVHISLANGTGRFITKKILNKIKVIMTIHILGNSSNIEQISFLAKKNGIYLIEDTCEALGSKFNSKYLGTFGDFGTYSFYYSHQITAGEGGMIVTNSKDDYDLLCSLRSHGWDRKTGKAVKKHKSYFNFINSGFNVRPTDINAAIANLMMDVGDISMSNLENERNIGKEGFNYI